MTNQAVGGKEQSAKQKRLKRIVIFGELLRFHATTPFYGDREAKILHELFREQIHAAAGIEPELALARERRLFDRDRFYSLCGHGGPTEEAWMQIVSGGFSREAAAYFAQCFDDAFVVCQEAGSVTGVMDAVGIPYLDLRVSPIRFLDDIYLAFASNFQTVRDRVFSYRIGDSEIRASANRMRAGYFAAMGPQNIRERMSPAGLGPNALLICGQTTVDLSLIQNGRVATFEDCREELDALIAGHDNVYFKKHPLNSQSDANSRFVRARPKIVPVAKNIYRMLSDDNLVAVAALSSGALTEARHFGKKVHYLLHEHVRLAETSGSFTARDYVMTGDEYFGHSFWADILSPVFDTRPGAFRREADAPPNRLRNILNAWWGYESPNSPQAPKPPMLLALARKAVNAIDPAHAIRSRIDPDGKARRKVTKLLSRR